MNTFTKVLIYIGLILTLCNQISAMRPILKDKELPPYEARLEPDDELIITNSTNVNTSSVWAENQFSDFEKSSAGMIGMALLPLLFKV